MHLQSGHPKFGPNSVSFREEDNMNLAINTVGDELQKGK